MTATGTEKETQLVEEILQRIAADLSMITDRELVIGQSQVERCTARPAGEGVVHISFRIAFEQGDELRHGCVLVPLPEAISLACYLMMVPDENIQDRRGLDDLDETTKDALLEVANFIGGAADAALREAVGVRARVRSEGCQGVPASVRPAMIYSEGEPLIVGRAKATVHDFPDFSMLVMLPELLGMDGLDGM